MKRIAGILSLLVAVFLMPSGVFADSEENKTFIEKVATYGDTKTYWCPPVETAQTCELELFGESSNLFRAQEEKLLGKCKTAMLLTPRTHKISAKGVLDCRYRLNGPDGPILTYRQNAKVKGCKLDHGWIKRDDGYECPGGFAEYCRAVCK
ncbi:MAG: hypothetical protein CMM48_02820 [Rhodospirillaceae bacterium]|nr:hypothetical protein [Rhodospirillaceae bacterium]